MAKRLNNDSPIGTILAHIMETSKLEAGLNQVRVLDTWKNIMGNGVNNYTKNLAYKNGSLYVELSSSVLREELSYGKDKICKLLNEELGKDLVREVILR